MIKESICQKILIVILSAAIFALSFAYISQYFFGMEPCRLCIYQRIPFFAVIFLIIPTLIIKSFKKQQKLILIISALLIAVNMFIALYHLGIENRIFTNSLNCSENFNSAQNIEDLKKILANTKVIRCDRPAFVFLDISMAGWNAIYCLALLLLAFMIFKETHTE